MRRPLFLLLALVLVVALPYLPGLAGGFVWLDWLEIVDGLLIVERWGDVPALFVDDRNFGGYHRPFYNLLHSLDRAVWGLEPFGFHLSSLVLHVTNVALVFALALRLRLTAGAAFALALLWGLHPVNTAVAGLVHAKADLFVTTTLLGTLLLLDDARRTGSPARAALALGVYAVALLTKETAAILPLGLVLAWICCPRPDPAARRLILGWTLAAAALAAGVLLPRVLAGRTYEPGVGTGERLLTFATVYVDYARALLLPVDLRIGDTVTRFGALSGSGRLRYAVAFVGVVTVQVVVWRRAPWARAWILLGNLALLPVSQLVPILHFRADRFLYLPSLALVGGLVQGAARWLGEPARARLRPIAGGALLLLALVFGSLCAARVRVFASDEALFRAELEAVPDYVEGLTALARAHDRAGRFDLGAPLWERALALSLVPARPRLSYVDRDALVVNLGFNALARGDARRAYDLLQDHGDLVTSARGRVQVDYNLAVAAYRLERYDEARPRFEAYVRDHPDDPSARFLLGRTAMSAGDAPAARQAFEAYLRLAPAAPDREQVERWLAQLEG